MKQKHKCWRYARQLCSAFSHIRVNYEINKIAAFHFAVSYVVLLSIQNDVCVIVG